MEKYPEWPGKESYPIENTAKRVIDQPFIKRTIRSFDKCELNCEPPLYYNPRFSDTTQQNFDISDQRCIGTICKKTNYDFKYPWYKNEIHACTECWNTEDVVTNFSTWPHKSYFQDKLS